MWKREKEERNYQSKRMKTSYKKIGIKRKSISKHSMKKLHAFLWNNYFGKVTALYMQEILLKNISRYTSSVSFSSV